MTDTAVNGASSTFAAGATESLRALVEQEETEQIRLKAQLEASTDRLKRLRKALAALTDDPMPAVAKPRKASPSIRQAKVDQVWQMYLEIGRPASATEISRSSDDLSVGATVRAIDVLRDQGKLRLVGRTQRGGGRVYEPMPEEARNGEAIQA